jgi:protein TonB
MTTAAALLLFTLLCLAFGLDRAWSNVTLPERNELVFAERHRGYGAYRLRTEYDRRLVAAFAAAVGLLALTAGVPMLIARMRPPVAADPPVIIVDVFDLDHVMTLPPERQAQQEKKTIMPPVRHQEKNPIVMAVDSARDPIIPPVDTSAIASSVPTGGGEGNTGTGADTLAAGGGGTALDDDTTTWKGYEVDERPEFPGGEPALGDWVKDHLDFPNGFSGRDVVHVQFTVGKDGLVTDVRAVTGKQASCKEAATRTVAHMPRWRPARRHGHAVPCRLTLPIRFEVR